MPWERADERLRALQTALNSLEDANRRVLEMFLHGRIQTEIADALGESEASVSERIPTGFTRIQSFFKTQFPGRGIPIVVACLVAQELPC